MSNARARRLRKNLTPWEVRFWVLARQWRSDGLHFRRQAPFGPYILDFVCHRARLVVELDGSGHATHSQIAYDRLHDGFLEGEGYRVIRLWNPAITEDQVDVFDWIHRVALERTRGNDRRGARRHPTPALRADPPHQGEG
mgnify:CR=1 FL=1